MRALLLYTAVTALLFCFNKYAAKKIGLINIRMKTGIPRWVLTVKVWSVSFFAYYSLTHFIFLKDSSMNPQLFLLATYGIGAYTYLIIFYIISDILAYIARKKAPFLSLTKITGRPYARGVLIVLAAAGIVIAGMINAAYITETVYNIKIAKSADYDSIRIAYLSDLQIGSSVRKANIDKIKRELLLYNPDIIMLGGKMTAVKCDIKLFEYFIKAIAETEAPLGKYFTEAPGAFPFRDSATLRSLMEQNGIEIIENYCKLKDDIYIAGIKDSKETANVLYGLASWKPVIVNSPIPLPADFAVKNRISLLLQPQDRSEVSFPARLITEPFNKTVRGLFENGGSVTVISGGCGVKDFPIRLKGKNEIVFINIKFTGDTTDAENTTL